MNSFVPTPHGELSICIPTYNRRERLLSQLDSIFSLPESTLVRIVIIDNASDYDVETSVIEQFGERLAGRVRFVGNKHNIGMASNLASLFLHCDTEWCWTLGDDDKVFPDSLSTILNDIERYPDVAFTKYTIPGAPQLPDALICSISEFWQYYANANDSTAGELVFLSNNLFNLRLLAPYLHRANEYSYTYVPHLLPPFFALKDGLMARFSSSSIVEYVAPDPGQHWSYHRVMMGLSTALHLDLGLSDELHRVMVRMLLHIDHAFFAEVILRDDERRTLRTWAVYKQMYETVYRYEEGFPLKQRIIYFTMWCFHRLKFSWQTVEKMHSYLIHHPEGKIERLRRLFASSTD